MLDNYNPISMEKKSETKPGFRDFFSVIPLDFNAETHFGKSFFVGNHPRIVKPRYSGIPSMPSRILEVTVIQMLFPNWARLVLTGKNDRNLLVWTTPLPQKKRGVKSL